MSCRLSVSAFLAEDFKFLEPGLHLIPGVFGGLLAVARAVIGMEAMRRARIDLELGGLAGCLQVRFHLLDLSNRNSLVRFAVEAEHRRLHFRRELRRALGPNRILR